MQTTTLVVGVDYSPASERALDAAIRTAREWHANLAVVHALRPLGAPGLDLADPPTRPERNETAEPSAGPAGGPGPGWASRAEAAGVPTDFVDVPGDPVTVLLDEARRRHAVAIVVGTHGRSGVGKAVLGSVAQGVVERSPVPVMVVPGATRP